MEETRTANLTIHPDEMQVFADDVRVGFTRREFELFSVLTEKQGRVARRDEIYRVIWGGEMRPRDRSVDVLVRKVRAKLTHAAPGWDYIHTHFGIGYRFEPQRVAPADTAAGLSGPSAVAPGDPSPGAIPAADELQSLHQASTPAIAS